MKLEFSRWFFDKALVKEVADKWFRPDGSAKYRAMTETMIGVTMKTYGLGLGEAAKLFERALLYYKDEHVCGGPEAYWSVVKGMQEMAGTDAIVNSCKPTKDYQVWGACSDLKGRNGKKKRRRKKRRS